MKRPRTNLLPLYTKIQLKPQEVNLTKQILAQKISKKHKITQQKK